jgi:glycosyltransferase involved in cell wall biosynthesis
LSTAAIAHKLKISLVVSDLSGQGAGRWGGASRPFLLAQALRRLGHEVKIYGLAFASHREVEFNTEIPMTVIPCPYYPDYRKTWTVVSELLRLLDGDILYAVKLKPSSFGIALLKKMLGQRPLMVDIDDWEMSWYGGDDWSYGLKPKGLIQDLFSRKGALKHIDHPLYLRWMEKLVDKADVVTRHTDFIGERFGGVYIPSGKDVDLFDPACYDYEASRSKYGLTPYKVLMFPGAPRPYKGVEDVLQALDILDQPQYKLVIVGGSPYDDYDRSLTQKWGKWLINLPKTPPQQMPEVVMAADAIVVPQQLTPATLAQFPLKLTDAMAMAKPILATSVGDIPFILAHTGYLVEPNSPPRIADAIDYIFNNFDLFEAKGKLARQRCVEYYSIDSMAHILDQILQPFLKKL